MTAQCMRKIGNGGGGYARCGLEHGHDGRCQMHRLIAGGDEAGCTGAFDCGGRYTVELKANGGMHAQILGSFSGCAAAMQYLEELAK